MVVYNRDMTLSIRITQGGVLLDIAGVSLALAQTKVQNNFGVAMLSKALDVTDEQGSALVNMTNKSTMELSVNPNIGSNFDVTV